MGEINLESLISLRDDLLKLKKLSHDIGIPTAWESSITGKNPWDGNGEQFLQEVEQKISEAQCS